MPDWNQYALFGVVLALWSQIRVIVDRIRALLVTKVLLDGEVAAATLAYIYEHGCVLDWGDRYIYSTPSFVRPLDRVTAVAIEAVPVQARIAWLGWCPVMFSSYGDQNSRKPYSRTDIHVSFIRGTLDVKRLTRLALERSSRQQTTGSRYRVTRVVGRSKAADYGASSIGQSGNSQAVPSGAPYCEITVNDRLLHWSFDDIGAQTQQAPFAAMVLDAEAETARSEFERWLELRTWYKERGIPWRRGFGLLGAPGTGKTSLARAFAQTADIPVYVFDLATLSNEEFLREWQEMQKCVPCMALIEDIDSCFDGRINTREGPDSLTFDCLLNAIGGIQSADGVFLIVTTNKPDWLDPALTRPGRLDRLFTLGNPTEDGRAAILQRIVGHARNLMETEGMTVAEVTEFAVSRALDETWDSSTVCQLEGGDCK